MNIVLIGFMGAGKTTVGKLLAKQIHWKFYDCDNLIIQKAELTVDEIFKLYGETKFRVLESTILHQLGKLNRVIIATGGGAVTRCRNIKLIKENGFVIYLYADIYTLYNRLKNDETKRPLLGKENFFSNLSHLVSVREELYNKIADKKIDTSNKTPQEVVEMIKIIIKRHKIIE